MITPQDRAFKILLARERGYNDLAIAKVMNCSPGRVQWFVNEGRRLGPLAPIPHLLRNDFEYVNRRPKKKMPRKNWPHSLSSPTSSVLVQPSSLSTKFSVIPDNDKIWIVRKYVSPVARIFNDVLGRYRLTKQEMLSACQKRGLVRARQDLMWQLRQIGMSYPQIARTAGRTDHSTAVHAVKRHQERLDKRRENV